MKNDEQSRETRLAEALRANLRRRKAQAKGRKTAEPDKKQASADGGETARAENPDQDRKEQDHG